MAEMWFLRRMLREDDKGEGFAVSWSEMNVDEGSEDATAQFPWTFVKKELSGEICTPSKNRGEGKKRPCSNKVLNELDRGYLERHAICGHSCAGEEWRPMIAHIDQDMAHR